MDPQLEQGGEHLAAEVAAVGQLLLVRPDVLQELIQLLEGLGAGLHNTLINLQGRVGGHSCCKNTNVGYFLNILSHCVRMKDTLLISSS